LGALLYLGDFDAALQALGEVFAIGRAGAEYHALEIALPLLRDDALERKGDALPILFGEERWSQLVQWLDGETFIWDMELITPERHSARHQALLRAHQRINRAMAQA
jgi:hypothetical protein